MTHFNVQYQIHPGPPPKPVGPIYLRPRTTDALVYHQIWNEELYRPVMGLRDYKLIIDGGANVGMSALYFAKHHPNALIFAIEPDAGNFGVLTRNVRDHAGDHAADIKPRRLALGGMEGVGVVTNSERGDFAREVIRPPASQDLFGDESTVPIVPVSHFLNLERPVLVKLDIEGGEVECFGEPRWLTFIDVLAVELHGRAAFEALNNALQFIGRRHRRWTVGETTFVEFT